MAMTNDHDRIYHRFQPSRRDKVAEGVSSIALVGGLAGPMAVVGAVGETATGVVGPVVGQGAVWPVVG